MLPSFRARQILWLTLMLTAVLGLGAYRYYRIVPALRFEWLETTWEVLLISGGLILAASIALVRRSRKSLPAKPGASPS